MRVKVAIVCDQLVHFDLSISILEQWLEFFPDAKLFALAHRPGQTSKRVEERHIYSSFLSNLVSDQKALSKYSFLFPTAAKSIELPEDTELVLTLSSGFSHLVKIPLGAKHLCYFLGESEGVANLSGLGKIFHPFLKKASTRALSEVDTLMLTSDVEKEKIEKLIHFTRTKVLPPFIDCHDFYPNQDKSLKQSKHFFHIDDFGTKLAKTLWTTIKEKGEKVCIIGEHIHKVEYQNKHPEMEFIGRGCLSSLNVYLNESKCFWDLSANFKEEGLFHLAKGIPIFATECAENRQWYRREGCVLYFNENDSFDQLMTRRENALTENPPEHFFRKAQRYNLPYHKTILDREIDFWRV